MFAEIEKLTQLVVLGVWFDKTKVELFELGPGFRLDYTVLTNKIFPSFPLDDCNLVIDVRSADDPNVMLVEKGLFTMFLMHTLETIDTELFV